jgi:hypothetical protein
MRVRPHLLAIAIAAGACGGSQADSSYPGDPLLEYVGLLGTTGPLPLFETQFVWQLGLPPDMGQPRLAESEAASWHWSGQLGLEFETVVYQPPPSDVFVQLGAGEVAFARGNTITVPLGTSSAEISQLPGSLNPAYATDLTYWILYFQADVPAGSLTEWWLHGHAVGAGYHYVRVDAPSCLSDEALDACAAELVTRGLPDAGTGPGTARAFCRTFGPYRVAPAATAEWSAITLGTSEFPALGCP